MVTKWMWKKGLIAESTFDAWHEGFTYGFTTLSGYIHINTEDLKPSNLRTNKKHHWLIAYGIGKIYARIINILGR